MQLENAEINCFKVSVKCMPHESPEKHCDQADVQVH